MRLRRRVKGTPILRLLAYVAAIAVLAVPTAAESRAATLETPLEAADFKSLPKNDDVIAYLRDVAAKAQNIRLEIIGRSSGNLPIAAVYLSDQPDASPTRVSSADKLGVLLIGSQHGTEPSGAEALQQIVRDVALGPMGDLLKAIDLTVVPIANPDGRNRRRRTNAKRVNLSTDFLVQTQPETRALTKLIRRIRPHVILDIHESAIYKRKSLGAQGFMTGVEAQFEIPNNPNVAASIRQIGREKILPEVIADTMASGLRASRYVGEITDIHQPITHGGLSLRNIRNYGGMLGSLAMLLENRLDPPGKYPTPRNIKVRVAKQHLTIEAFLTVVKKRKMEIREALKRDPHRTRSPSEPLRVALDARYETDSHTPTIRLPMSTIKKGQGKDIVVDRDIEMEFAYHSRIASKFTIPLPRAYAITANQQAIGELFERHGIEFETLAHGRRARAEVQYIDVAERRPIPYRKVGTMLKTKTTPTVRDIQLDRGDLWVDLKQPLGALVPLMLDPRSSTSIYRDRAFASHIQAGHVHYAVAIH